MSVNSIQGGMGGATGVGPHAPPSQEIGEEEFLTLLMAQLGNQDPLNPMESAEFMQQISAMNSVKQLMTANEQLEGLMMGLTSLNNQTAVDLVGKTVIAQGNQIQHRAGEPSELRFELAEDVTEATITITDSSGSIVDTIELTEVEMGIQTRTWDGTGSDGAALPDGEYKFSVYATNEAGESVESLTYITGRVDELRFDRGYPVLFVAGAEVSLAQILRVLLPDEAGPLAGADPESALDVGAPDSAGSDAGASSSDSPGMLFEPDIGAI